MSIKDITQLSVGDRVRLKRRKDLRKDFGITTKYGFAAINTPINITRGMMQYLGTIVTIDYKGCCSFRVKEDGGVYNYPYEAIEGKTED